MNPPELRTFDVLRRPSTSFFNVCAEPESVALSFQGVLLTPPPELHTSNHVVDGWAADCQEEEEVGSKL